jgi:hypothetical protein
MRSAQFATAAVVCQRPGGTPIAASLSESARGHYARFAKGDFMKWKNLAAAIAIAAATTALSTAQDSAHQHSTSSTTVVTGPVVQYSPGQTIVIRGADGKMVTYTIGSSVQVPAEVQVGKTVSISSAPAADGSGPAVVTRIETTSVDSQGRTKMTTERTEQSASGTTRTTTTTTYGTVTAYVPKSSITIESPTKELVTYSIDTASELPQDIAIGKIVTIDTRTVPGSKSPVIRRIEYRKVEKVESPQ